MAKKPIKQQENEYDEILQQAVAVINETRISIARQLNASENTAYWKIGKLLYERKLESKHGNILLLMRAVADDDNRALFYATECVSKEWPRDLLVNAVQMQMYEHAILTNPTNNFEKTLPENQVKFANETFRSSYNVGFLGVTDYLEEVELEKKLVEKVKLILLELGEGLCLYWKSTCFGIQW